MGVVDKHSTYVTCLHVLFCYYVPNVEWDATYLCNFPVIDYYSAFVQEILEANDKLFSIEKLPVLDYSITIKFPPLAL